MALQYLYNIKGRTPTGNNSCSFFISNICSMSTICPFHELYYTYLIRKIIVDINIYKNKTRNRISKTNICYNNYSRWGIMPFFR